jgi:predicted RNase H-like HicB family nuclease
MSRRAMAAAVSESDVRRVVFERDDNDRWFVHCPDLPGAHSHGRTLASDRSNIREAIGLVVDVTDRSSIELTEEIQLDDPTLQESVEQARQLRHRADVLEQRARAATVEAIERSAESDVALSMRDLADLLGLSHQRVQQISAAGTPR